MNESIGVLTFLGTGASMGVPVIGCPCQVCHSTDPHNKRYRTSALCQIKGKNILIDCGPDFRSQALANHVTHLDGVIITHAHNDHTAGLDDLKVFCFFNQKPLQCLMSQATYEDIKRRFTYLLDGKTNPHIKMQLVPQLLEGDRGEITFLEIPIRYFTYEQLGMKVNGFRLGNMAYVTDIRNYPETIFKDLKGVETLVLSALKFGLTPMHLSVDEAIEFSERVGAQKTWLVHLAHDLDHEKTNAYLPASIRLAYDGLRIEF